MDAFFFSIIYVICSQQQILYLYNQVLYTKQQTSMPQTFVSNSYYPLNYEYDQIVSWVRKIICITFCLEILLIAGLRICSIVLSTYKIHHHKQADQKQKPSLIEDNREIIVAKKQDIPIPFPVLQLQSAVNLKEQNQKKLKDAKMKFGPKTSQNFKKEKQKIKVVDISKKKQNHLRKKNANISKISNVKKNSQKKEDNKQNKQQNKQIIKIQQKENTTQQIIKRKPILKQSNLTSENQQKVAFNFDQVIEFPSESSSSSSSSSSSQSSSQSQSEYVTEQKQHQLIKQRKRDVKHFIKIKHLNKSFTQFSSIVNLLFSHFTIAFSVAILYFPYAHTALLSMAHLILLMILTLLNIFCQKDNKAKKYVNRLICGLIYMINLAVILLSIFGITKSNYQYYQKNQILLKSQK